MKRFWMAGSLLVLSSVACGAADTSREVESERVGEQDDALTASTTTSTTAPSATVPTIRCGAHGTPRVVDGIEACGCADGYAGQTCEVCATGYAASAASNACIPIPVNRDVVIDGTESLVPYGGSVVLSALSARPSTAPTGATGAPVPGTWSISADGGCLAHPDRPDVCLASLAADKVLFKAPATGTELSFAEVTFTPSGGGPAIKQGVKLGVFGDVPINGSADISTLPVVNQVLDVMKKRCVGGATLGIARHGKVVAALGMGMKDGRNAEKIFNGACSDDPTDPFKPGAGEMRHDTPYMVGSVSKAPAYATARYAIKKALKAHDVDVRMIAQTPSRFVTATRTAAGQGLLRIDVWDLAADGTFTKKGFDAPTMAKDFELVRMGDTRFVIVMRNAEDKVNMSAYQIDAQGNPIVTKALFGATVAKQVQVTSVNDQRVVVALRLPNDNLQVRTFKLANDGDLTLLSHENGGSTRDVRIVGLPGTSRFVGVARLGNPDVLEFIVWNVTDAGVLQRIHETTFDNQFHDAQEFELTALSASRIAVGVRGAPNAEINVSTIAVGGSGALDVLGGTFVPQASGGFRLERADATHFGVVTYGKGTGNLHRLTVGNGGIPFQEGNAITTGSSRGADVVPSTGIGTGPGFVTSVRTTGDELALTSWGLQGSALVKRKAVVGGTVTDFAWTDDDVEDLSLVGFDLPNGLVPKRVHEIVAGYVEPPFHADATDARSKATCTATAAPGYPKSDSGWRTMRLRHFFAHRGGLNFSNVPYGTLLANLGKIRGVTNANGWLGQENQERELWTDAQMSSARQAAGLSSSVDVDNPDGFLLPRVDGEDFLVASASMCLPNVQGTYNYSNTDPVWLQNIMEHVTGQPYSAPVGNPNAVAGTLLKEFVDSNLGITAGPLTGLFGRPAAPDAQGNDVFKGPRRRHWDGTTYYPQVWDTKRPYCTWSGDSCNVASTQTLDWNGKKAMISLDLSPNGASVATGSIAVQVVPHLAFLKNYWAGGYDSNSSPATFNPTSGERRNGVWTVNDGHNGGDNGMWAFALQYGTKCGGKAEGIDITVSFNQWKDKVCDADDQEGKSVCVDALSYTALASLIESAVCKVDWTKAKPVPGLND